MRQEIVAAATSKDVTERRSDTLIDRAWDGAGLCHPELPERRPTKDAEDDVTFGASELYAIGRTEPSCIPHGHVLSCAFVT